MTDKEKLAEAEARLAKAEKALAERAEFAPTQAPAAPFRTQADIDVDRKLAANAAIRAKLKAQTLRRGDMYVYLVGPEQAYRGGRLYRAGEEIELPHSEMPSFTFLAIGKAGQPLDADGKPADKPSTAPVKGTGRPSDEEI